MTGRICADHTDAGTSSSLENSPGHGGLVEMLSSVVRVLVGRPTRMLLKVDQFGQRSTDVETKYGPYAQPLGRQRWIRLAGRAVVVPLHGRHALIVLSVCGIIRAILRPNERC